MSNIHQLPLHTQDNWKDRNCPNMRNCWHFSWDAYNLHTSDTAVLCRRICMILILGIRTAVSILAIFFRVYGGYIYSFVFGTIFAVIGFLFIAWCLARIGEVQGTRKVLGTMIGRWHFDVALAVCALVHVGMLVGLFFGPTAIILTSTWHVMWLLIFLAAWIAGWTAEEEVYI